MNSVQFTKFTSKHQCKFSYSKFCVLMNREGIFNRGPVIKASHLEKVQRAIPADAEMALIYEIGFYREKNRPCDQLRGFTARLSASWT